MRKKLVITMLVLAPIAVLAQGNSFDQWLPYLLRAAYRMTHRSTWFDFEYGHVNSTTWDEATNGGPLAVTWGELED